MPLFKRLTIPLALALLALAAQASTAAARPTAPLPIGSASLTQDGQQLVWKLQMGQAFAPQNLQGHGLSICLLVLQGRGAATAHRLCISGPLKHQHRSRLVYFGPHGKHHRTPASVTRSSHSELTAKFLPAVAHFKYRGLRWQVQSTYLPAGCMAGTTSCQQVVTSKLRRLRVHTPKLVGCVPHGPDWVFHGPSNRHEIALTFDDGPSPEPPATAFVNLLHRMNVPATFMEIGEQIPEFDSSGAIERKMLADGDMIGDHTWTHPDMTTLSASAQRSELELTAAAIRHRTGFTPCLFRPPYGAVDSQLLGEARSLGFATIQWDIDPRDWSLPGTAAIEQNVIDNAHNGAIVLQHFGGGPRYETLAALPDEINTLRGRGYKFVTVTQLLGYKLIYR